MSVWYLISNAGVLVQLVMLLLLFASVASWALILQRVQVFRKAQQSRLAFEERFWSGMDLGQLYREVAAEPTPFSGMESIFRAGFREFSRLRQQSHDADAVMDGAQRAMRVAFSREQERLEASLPFLATVGRFYQSLHRPVRNRMGHYELLSRAGTGAAGNLGHSGARYFRSLDCNRHGLVRSHSCGYRLQPLCRALRCLAEKL